MQRGVRGSASWRPLAAAALLGSAWGLGAAGRAPAAAQSPSRPQFVPTFASNARLKQQVERLERLAAQKLWDDWLNAYQQLVEEDRDYVLPRDTEFLVGLRYHLHQQLAGLPAVVRQRYRTLFDGAARKRYEKALAEGDAAGMREVYTRYRFSSFAPRALLWLANQALDQGRPEMARIAYARLAQESGTGPTLLLRYALAADAAGRPAEARAILDRVKREFPAEPVQLAGQQLAAAEAAERVARSLRPAPPAARPPEGASGWTSFPGPRGDRHMAPLQAAGGPEGTRLQVLWSFEHPTTVQVAPRLPGNRPVAVHFDYNSARAPFQFLTFPVLRGDRLWVQGPRNMAALDRGTGKPVWVQQERWSVVPDEAVAPARVRAMIRYANNSLRPLQAAPAVEGTRLFARIPLVASEREAYLWPKDLALAAFDLRTGQELWRRVGGGDPPIYYWNTPTVHAGVVLSGMNSIRGGMTEFSATALDAHTGEPLWTTYLGGGSDPFNGTDGSPAAVRDGIVWIESSLYTLNALDLLTGEIRVIYRYTPERRLVGFRGGFDSSPMVTNEPISLIASGPGPIVFAPRWGTDVVALDPTTGKLLWSSPKAPGQGAQGVLFAADDRRVYIAGDYVQAIHLSDGAREWSWEPQGVSGVGYPALCGDRILVPVDGKLRVLSAADGRELETAEVSGGSGALFDGYAALTAADGLLFLTTDDRIVALGPKR